MVVKKIKSKRITTKKREKIKKKVTEHHRKERRRKRLENKNKIKVPLSIYRTEEETQVLEKIKKDSEIRKANYKVPTLDDGVNEIIEQNEYFIQILDPRYPLLSKNCDLENRITDLKKKFVSVLSDKYEIPAIIKNEWKKRDSSIVNSLGDIKKEINENIKICVMGMEGIGKSTLIYKLHQIFNNIKVTEYKYSRGELPFQINNNFIIDILEGRKRLKNTEVLDFIQKILMKMNKEEIMFVYKIPDFDDVEDFLIYFGKSKNIPFKKGKDDVISAGRLFLEDIISMKISYYVDPLVGESNELSFKINKDLF